MRGEVCPFVAEISVFYHIIEIFTFPISSKSLYSFGKLFGRFFAFMYTPSSWDRVQGVRAILWAYHQRFFASLCMSAKVEVAVGMARSALAAGKCVVVGLQNTGESVAGPDSAAEDDELASTADGIARSFLERHCVARGMDEELCNDLLRRLDDLHRSLPSNPLDELIDQLGGPDKVSEMTGRKHRYVRSAMSGKLEYVVRTRNGSEETVNIAERQAFQAGRKLVAVISQATNIFHRF